MRGCARRERRRESRHLPTRRAGRSVVAFHRFYLKQEDTQRAPRPRWYLRQRGISRPVSSSEYSYRIGSRRPCSSHLSERSRPPCVHPRPSAGDQIDTTAFTLTRKSNIATVGRPDRAVVRSRVGRQRQRFTGVDQFHVYVGVVLFGAIPDERDLPAVG